MPNKVQKSKKCNCKTQKIVLYLTVIRYKHQKNLSRKKYIIYILKKIVLVYIMLSIEVEIINDWQKNLFYH